MKPRRPLQVGRNNPQNGKKSSPEIKRVNSNNSGGSDDSFGFHPETREPENLATPNAKPKIEARDPKPKNRSPRYLKTETRNFRPETPNV